MKKGISIWTKEKIKEGFERFKKENGRIPMSQEIDIIEYLPSRKTIERNFGGLEKLRFELGYTDTHFGKGIFRSQIAKKSNIRGRDIEIYLQNILQEKFHEVFVHTEKIFDNSKNRVDFYIYCPDGNFGIDIFYTEHLRDLQKNINIKIDKYKTFPLELFLVVGNDKFEQKELDQYMLSKRKALPSQTTIITLNTLLNIIKNKNNYPNPINF